MKPTEGSDEDEPVFEGTVENQVFGRRSKSEVLCPHLVGRDGSKLRLRRRGVRWLGDQVLYDLLGRDIVATGEVRNGTLFLEQWRECGEHDPGADVL